GGGLELAMACHFRVAVRGARVGQPEVLLGIIPGAGGTQRLPRLADAQLALTMCTDGRPIPAAKALAAGTIHAIGDGDLLAGGIAFAKNKAASKETRKTREIVLTADARRAGLEAASALRAAMRAPKDMNAPRAAISAIEGAFTLPFDEGALKER